ncbi:MAG: Ig-like domain-containing protein [Cyclobacteriaceae bacterium]|nr:Ig-like domain-containing protein [Cyclobacteriaceae bacterium]
MRRLIFASLIFTQACIGTDVVDDPIVGEKLEIMPDRLGLLEGTTATATAVYYNQFGVAEDVSVVWSLSAISSIATVSTGGVVTGNTAGGLLLYARFGTLEDFVRVSVVKNATDPAFLDISAPTTALEIDETVSLSAAVTTINGTLITSASPSWSSMNPLVATVDGNGVVTAVGNGTTFIDATVSGAFSERIMITVGGAGENLTGTFMSANGYHASGMATLANDGDDLILTFSDDFMTSFALGTFIYLANNNTSGTTIKSQGIELGQITNNGSHTFNVTEKFPDAMSSQYQYVIVLCKPASVVFGFAELKN